MSFWIIAFGLGALVAAAMIMAMNLRGKAGMETGQDVQVYKHQLSDIDRDVARGVISSEEAEQSRIEVSRRLLLADETMATVPEQETSSFNFFVGAVVAIVLLGGTAEDYGCRRSGRAGWWRRRRHRGPHHRKGPMLRPPTRASDACVRARASDSARD